MIRLKSRICLFLLCSSMLMINIESIRTDSDIYVLKDNHGIVHNSHANMFLGYPHIIGYRCSYFNSKQWNSEENSYINCCHSIAYVGKLSLNDTIYLN